MNEHSMTPHAAPATEVEGHKNARVVALLSGGIGQLHHRKTDGGSGAGSSGFELRQPILHLQPYEGWWLSDGGACCAEHEG